jgi:hypothetical protein
MAKAPKNHRQPWTPEQEKAVRTMAKGNTPTRVIALKLGRTEDAIYNKAQELDVSLSPTNQSPYNRRAKP